ncbi:MAG: DNA/RNA non-specific endonuclease [Bacteroidales bacterium]
MNSRNFRSKYGVLILLLFLLGNCSDDSKDNSVPTITTSAVVNIEANSAVSGGIDINDGGAAIQSKGVCWSTQENPTVGDSKTDDGNGKDDFTSQLTGLSAGETYHVRAYAINSVGTAYGNDLSFTTTSLALPSVTTSAVSEVTSTSAVSGGNVIDDGGSSITTRGVCWSTQENPTVSDSKTDNGSGTGDFTSQLTALSAGETYHVRAYAINSVGTAYGNDVSFTASSELPSVTTSAVSDITSTSAVSGGNVIDDGGSSITARGVCWSTTTGTTISDSKTVDGSGMGTFSSNLSGLSSGTTYYVRSYATNSAGTAYGEELSFTTESGLPGVTDNDNMMLGNPSNATADVVNANNYLMVKSQYCLSYNNSKLTTNWTSWHLYSGDTGSTDRQDDFRADATLPSSWYHVDDDDYQYSTYGFDRGHMCPSADRTLTVSDNSATFLMTNMIPQAPNNNQQTWANLENYCRTLVDNGNELYIISGPYGEGGTSAKGTFTVLASGVVVPNKTWKIIVVLPNGNNDLSRITTSTRVIAVLMPNSQTCSEHPWAYYRVSVDSLESLTGYNFLSNIPSSIQNTIEANVDNVSVK